MKSQLHFKEATISDVSVILDLYNQPEFDSDGVLSEDDAQPIFDKISKYPSYKFYLAEWDDRVVGTFSLLVMDKLGHYGAPSAIVEDVVVSEKAQGQGIGKAMMQYARALAHEAGCYKMVLSSNQKRVLAHQFYESLGFTRHGYSFYVDI